MPIAAFETDANTAALWLPDGTGAAPDSVGGYDLEVDTGAPAVISGPFTGGGIELDGDDDRLAATVDDDFRSLVRGVAGWTLELAIQIDTFGTFGGVLGLGDPSGDWLLELLTWEATDHRLSIGNTASGRNTLNALSSGGGAIPEGMVMHLAITKEADGDYTGWVNGVRMNGQAALGASAPAATDNQKLYLGFSGAGTSDVYGAFKFHGAKLSNVVLTEAQIRASYDRWLSGQDQSAPTISNVSPADGGAIGRNEAWGARVTDNTAFRRVMLTATFTRSDGSTMGPEVIWDGSAFSPLYSAASSRTEVVAGRSYDFSVKRSGGWPYAPTIEVIAIDTSGNEAA